MPIIVSCKDAGGTVATPSGSETGATAICNSIPNTFWPKLANSYTYDAAGTYNNSGCNFKVNTNTDTTNLGHTYVTCDCISQVCN
jgi:hypothetical protein